MNVNYKIYSNQPQPHNYGLFNQNVRNYLFEADKVAVNIVRPVDAREQRQEDAAVNYYVRRPNCLRSRVTFFNVNIMSFEHRGYGRRQKSDGESRGAILILGAMIAAAGFYFLGLEMNARELLSEQMNKSKDIRKVIKSEVAKDPEHPHLVAMKKVSDCEQSIFSRLKRQSDLRLALIISTVATGALFIGAALASPAIASGLLVLGTVAGISALMAGMFQLGYSGNKRAVLKDAEAMKKALDELKEQDRIYQSNGKGEIPVQPEDQANNRGKHFGNFGASFQPAY